MVDPVSNGHALGPVDKTSPETGHIKPSPQIPQWTSVTDGHRLAVNNLQHGDVKLTVPSKGLFLEGEKDPPKAGLNIPGADSAPQDLLVKRMKRLRCTIILECSKTPVGDCVSA
jgi:hypothetical protein